MASERRRKQIARQVRERVAQLLLHELKDPRAGLITVTEVEVNGDLTVATVRWTVFDPEQQRVKTEKLLQHARGFLRSEVAHALGLRQAPQLVFHYDEGLERAERIERLLGQVLPPEPRRDAGGTDVPPS